MDLRELRVRSFRNLADADFALEPGTTLLLGANGQGKTSFLEAVGVLATARSFRRAKAAEMARRGSADFSVAGAVESGGHPTRLSLEVSQGRRLTSVGGTAVELAEYIGHLTVVPITQAQAGIVRGGPQDRRDFLDRGVLGIRPPYLRTLASYRRTLRHKNALLRVARAAPSASELAAWNERLARDGAELTVRRREYVALLAESLAEVGPTFLPPGEQLALSVQDVVARDPSLASRAAEATREEVAAALLARFEVAAAREIAARQALVGPHRDDLLLAHAAAPDWPERDLRRFASSGQQRNALLALKMAKVEVFRRRRGEPPVLLVDDVDTEVDPRRLATFLEHAGGRAQALVTSSKRELLDALAGRAATWHVEAGVISPG